jgi:hypothetical protein
MNGVRVVHFNVTAHPTAEWTAQQLREAFPFDRIPRYLLRDRDKIFGRCLPQTSPGHEDRGSVVGSAIALAARLRRAGDWLHTARMPGPCDRLPRSRSTPDAVPVFFLLSPNAPAPFVGKGLTGATGSSTGGVGPSSGDTSGRRTAPPIRAARRLKRHSLQPTSEHSQTQCDFLQSTCALARRSSRFHGFRPLILCRRRPRRLFRDAFSGFRYHRSLVLQSCQLCL